MRGGAIKKLLFEDYTVQIWYGSRAWLQRMCKSARR